MKKKIDFVLITDDDEATRFLHRIMAEEAGVTDRILEAKGGQSGIETILQLLNENPNIKGLTFMDINMPVVNGWMVLDEIREHMNSSNHSIAIYMVTSSEYPKDLERIKKEPLVKGHIPKPLTAESIIEAAEILTSTE